MKNLPLILLKFYVLVCLYPTAHIMKVKDLIAKIRLKNSKSLIDFVNEEKKISPQVENIIKKKLSPIWMPSRSSFLRVFAIIMFFGVIAHLHFLNSWILIPVLNLTDLLFADIKAYEAIKHFINYLLGLIPEIDLPFASESHYQNLIAIHAGIGAVLIGLSFFVAESLANSRDPDKARVLLYKSYFFPLLVSEILTFFIFLWGNVNALSTILIFAIAFGTIWSLGTVIDLLINDYHLEQAKVKMFFEIIRNNFVKILDFEVTRRVGTNILVNRLSKNELIEIGYWRVYGREEDYVKITSTKQGLFTNLYFHRLENFLNELKVINLDLDVGSDKYVTKNHSAPEGAKLCYLPLNFYKTVKIGDPLFYIQSKLFDHLDPHKRRRILADLEKMAQEVFKIENIVEPEKEAQSEISKIKDRCITAITNNQTGELEKLISLYVDLTTEFYEFIKPYGGGFSKDQAEKERSSIFDKLKPTEWLSRDIREVFERGLESEDKGIVREVAYLPMKLASGAIDNKDHLIFQEFIYFPQMLYSFAIKQRDKGNIELAEFLFDRTWRYLKELSDYSLVPKIRVKDFEEENFKDFGVYLFKIFQNLLKKALDKKDIQNFNTFLNKTLALFDDMETRGRYSMHDKSEKLYNYLDSKRNEMLFGLATWILGLYEKNKYDDEIKKFYQTVVSKLPHEIIEFTNIFLNSHHFEVEKFWDWDDWELEGLEEGRVYCVQTLEKLEKFFVINSLNLISNKTDEEIKKIDLPTSRDLAFLVEGVRDLMKVIGEIESSPGDWNFVLTDNAAAKTIAFRGLLDKAKDKQEDLDLKRKRETPVSKEKIYEFKESVIENFNKTQTLRSILVRYGLYKDNSKKEYKGELKKLGINTVSDKAAFFGEKADWHINYSDTGIGFGRGMATGENNAVLKIIKKASVEIAEKEFETTLRSLTGKDIIIVGINGALFQFFSGKEGYKPDYQHSTGCDGNYQFEGCNIPVFELHTGGNDSEIYLLDVSRLGVFTQFSPIDESDEESLRKDVLLIDVKDFRTSAEKMEEFIKKPPKWLKEMGNVQKQREYLLESVLIQIYERFEFKLKPDFIGFYVKVRF